MLSLEINVDGVIRIEGVERELRDLASHLLEAAVMGKATPAFVSDQAVTRIEIICLDTDDA